MYSSKSFVLFICLSLSIVLLWCSVNGSKLDSSEQQDHSLEINEDYLDDLMDMYRRASLRPFVVHQRASLRPFPGKRASLRPTPGKRASLRPTNGKRASLRPTGKRASLRPSYFQ